jgi:flagellar hook-associated protein 2
LVGATGDASEGLNLRITGTTIGARGTVSISIGFASQLSSIMTDILKSDGILTAKTNGLSSSITRLTKQEDAQNDRLAIIEKRYREQFTKLESTINSLNSTSTYLTQQLSAIANNN